MPRAVLAGLQVLPGPSAKPLPGTLAADNQALCEAIIVMAHKLGIRVIAEGIETEPQRTILAAAGCDFGQGFFFSRPLRAAQFEDLVLQRD